LTWKTRLIFFFLLPGLFSIALIEYLFALLFETMHVLSTLDWLLPGSLGYLGTNLIPLALFLYRVRKRSIHRSLREKIILRPVMKVALVLLGLTTLIVAIFAASAAVLWVAFCLGTYFAFFDPPEPNGPAEWSD
jgi:hypothetical protein